MRLERPADSVAEGFGFGFQSSRKPWEGVEPGLLLLSVDGGINPSGAPTSLRGECGRGRVCHANMVTALTPDVNVVSTSRELQHRSLRG